MIDYLNVWHSREKELEVNEFIRSTHSMHFFYDAVVVIEKRKIKPPICSDDMDIFKKMNKASLSFEKMNKNSYRPILTYLNPFSAISSVFKMFRPSMMLGEAISFFILSKSATLNSSHSVIIRRAWESLTASYLSWK